MNLYISGSNRNRNCYKLLKELKEKELQLKNKININYRI